MKLSKHLGQVPIQIRNLKAKVEVKLFNKGIILNIIENKTKYIKRTLEKKELSFCHKILDLWYFNFQTMNSVRPNNLSLKYQRFTTSGCKDKEKEKFEFSAKTHLFM